MKKAFLSLTLTSATLFLSAARADAPKPAPPAQAAGAAELLQRYDLNHDGKLDENELAAAHEGMLKNNDGFRGTGGGERGKKMRAQLLMKFDKNGDGQLDENERAEMRKFSSSATTRMGTGSSTTRNAPPCGRTSRPGRRPTRRKTEGGTVRWTGRSVRGHAARGAHRPPGKSFWFPRRNRRARPAACPSPCLTFAPPPAASSAGLSSRPVPSRSPSRKSPARASRASSTTANAPARSRNAARATRCSSFRPRRSGAASSPPAPAITRWVSPTTAGCSASPSPWSCRTTLR